MLPFDVLQQAINHRLENILVHILRLNYKLNQTGYQKDNTVYEEKGKKANYVQHERTTCTCNSKDVTRSLRVMRITNQKLVVSRILFYFTVTSQGLQLMVSWLSHQD